MAIHLRNTKVVLHDLDLHIPDGSCISVIGQNGVAKSTFLRLIFWHAATGHDLMLRTCPTSICIDNGGIRCQGATAEVLDTYRNG